jgi:PBP1b-binding outer membrane lipoprotein LpoB
MRQIKQLTLIAILALILSSCSKCEPKTVYVKVFPDLETFDVNLSDIPNIDINYTIRDTNETG